MRPDPAREARLLAAAVTTLTRLPLPHGVLSADWLARSAKYYPLVGAAIGAAMGCVLVGASFLYPAPVPAILALGVGLLLTGALHEDGLADTADGLGARGRTARLAAMKDPRLGPFGVLALLVALSLKVALLSRLPVAEAAAALVASCAVGRLWADLVMNRTSYAGDRDVAKLDHGIEGPRPAELVLALVFALLPLLLLPEHRALAGLAGSALAATLVAVPVCRSLGGHTGDVLGAVIVAGEVGFLLGAAAGP
ncbi:adenosylcobinamide-GDP ribazoletransferase [Enterovirga rhinocerotis]|uniref:Adenosylcobinamide-GDP ribazoletransferase n=1 Tax=Enterovirga rhinocerotis TaxID=1339210 RepID=A0A4R7BP62_9HYPH|nr:adenosylcobinamide-GDP ribazoletransferase [Enterovirga rhinocerotis]TDR87308.1 cobalamin-5'-phosphate synthase [Enterovirga rhinocerotis]